MNTEQQIWKDYQALKSHLVVLSKMVLDSNLEAARSFANKTEDILKKIDLEREIMLNRKHYVYVCNPDYFYDQPLRYDGKYEDNFSQICWHNQMRDIRYVNRTNNGTQIQLYSQKR